MKRLFLSPIPNLDTPNVRKVYNKNASFGHSKHVFLWLQYWFFLMTVSIDGFLVAEKFKTDRVLYFSIPPLDILHCEKAVELLLVLTFLITKFRVLINH